MNELPTLTGLTRAGEPVQVTPVDERRWAVQVGLRNPLVVGRIELRPEFDNAESAHLQVAVDLRRRGQGLASAALRAVAGWALSAGGGGYRCLRVVTPVGAWPARRLLWACGFHHEGVLRAALPGGVDAWSASLLAGETTRADWVWFDPPVLRNGDTQLRPARPSDVPRIVSGCRDPLSQHFLPKLPRDYRDADAQSFLQLCADEHAGRGGLHWAITDEQDLLIGHISLMGLAGGTSRQGEVGYWLHPDQRGRSLTRSAVRAVARHALLPVTEGGLGLDRVLLRTAASNLASQRVALDCGFTAAGRDRAAERLGDGTLDDHLRFDLVPADLDETWSR